ncbi:YqcC family protein, partial [Escherichia coli]|uniref:YqcC family protein n=1 Tax=Escherichia coli TaxID=562 RepID=UPI001EF55A4D
RMHDLLDNKQPLPGAFAVAPYYEMALATDHPQRALILAELEKQHQIQKRYHAIVRGWLMEEAVLDYPLVEELDKIADKFARED